MLVIDDDPLMLRSLVDALEREPDFTVCGQAGDVPEALAAAASQLPDVVLTDLHLKTTSGLDLIRQLHTEAPGLPVIATTMFDVDPQRTPGAGGGRGRLRPQTRRAGKSRSPPSGKCWPAEKSERPEAGPGIL